MGVYVNEYTKMNIYSEYIFIHISDCIVNIHIHFESL